MQDEVNEKVVAISVKASGITLEVLQKAVIKLLQEMKKQKGKTKHGKQTLKQLMKQDVGVSNIEITDGNIKGFTSIAKKYGVDFALKKDSSENPPRYLVFFKGRDADVLTAVFKEFSAMKLKQKKTSLLETLADAKAEANLQIPKEKITDRGLSR
ncbi:MAG: PcfB family protein [Clostridia bacterium]|nr:PcfB family protein [Clostridia bacterium]